MEETVVAGMGQATLGDPEMGAPRDSSTFLRDAGAVVTTGPLLVTSWQGRAWSRSRPESCNGKTWCWEPGLWHSFGAGRLPLTLMGPQTQDIVQRCPPVWFLHLRSPPPQRWWSCSIDNLAESGVQGPPNNGVSYMRTLILQLEKQRSIESGWLHPSLQYCPPPHPFLLSSPCEPCPSKKN